VEDTEIVSDVLTRGYRQLATLISKERGLRQVPFAQLLALAEAAKIRVISMGQDHLYSFLHGLRKILFRGVRRIPAIVCDRPITSSIVSTMLGRCAVGSVFVSGDYKAATNNLNPELAEFCANEICDVLGLDEATRRMFLTGLTGHEICFGSSWDISDDFSLPGFATATQKWGQLMGSPVSFPILCLINLACISVSLHFEPGRTYPSIRDERILINGDDCAFQATRLQLHAWKDCAESCGLQLSVGKTYYSPDWVMINSTIFEQLPAAPCSCANICLCPSDVFRQHYFLNLGIMYGLKRSGDGQVGLVTDDQFSMTLGERSHYLISGLPESVATYAMHAFIACNRTSLWSGIPWFVPSEYGGYGLASFGPFQPSSLDKSICAFFALRDRGQLIGSSPPPNLYPSRDGSNDEFPLTDHIFEQLGCTLKSEACRTPALTFPLYRSGYVISDTYSTFLDMKEAERVKWYSSFCYTRRKFVKSWWAQQFKRIREINEINSALHLFYDPKIVPSRSGYDVRIVD
jgi:hypothetical protein